MGHQRGTMGPRHKEALEHFPDVSRGPPPSLMQTAPGSGFYSIGYLFGKGHEAELLFGL